MDRETNLLARSLALFLPLLAFTAFFQATTARAQIDASLNTTVWKMLYGVTDAQINDPNWLAADDDGDGISNGAELAAGTNPFNPASKLAVTSLSATATAVSLAVPTAAGKYYVVQTSTNLTDPAGWASLSPSVEGAGDGTPKVFSIPRTAGGPDTFYRVVALDIDTDGDGVTDWAEKATGLDPASAHTHGAAMDDHTALVNDLAAESVVTITATKASATQPPDAATAASDVGTISFTRGGPCISPR